MESNFRKQKAITDIFGGIQLMKGWEREIDMYIHGAGHLSKTLRNLSQRIEKQRKIQNHNTRWGQNF